MGNMHSSNYAASVGLGGGYVDVSGDGVYGYDGGVRPALWLNL